MHADQLQPKVLAGGELAVGQPQAVVPAVSRCRGTLQYTRMSLRIGGASQPDRPWQAFQIAQPEVQALPVYHSPLSEYRPYRVDEPLRPWKDANDEVGRLGGHMGHLAHPAGGGAR